MDIDVSRDCVGLFSHKAMKAWWKYPSESLEAGMLQDASLHDRDAYLTHLHEWMHYLQTVGSSIGLQSWRSGRVQRSIIQEAILNLKDSLRARGLGTGIHVPLATWTATSQDIHIRRILKSYVQIRWRRAEMLSAALWGGYSLFQEPEIGKKLEKFGFGVALPPRSTLSPHLKINERGDMLPVGASVVVEAAASALEWVTDTLAGPVRGQRGDVEMKIARRRLGREKEYTILLRAVDDAGLWPPSLAALLLADIALNPPVPIPGDEPMRWEDLHPGHRFVRAMNVLASMPSCRLSCSEESVNKHVVAVCAECGWPTPSEAAYRYWSFHKAQTRAMGIFDDAPEHALYERAISFRQRHPACFVFPWFRGGEMTSTLPFPFFHSANEGMTFNVPRTDWQDEGTQEWAARMLGEALCEHVTRKLVYCSELAENGFLPCPMAAWRSQRDFHESRDCRRGCEGLRVGSSPPSDCMLTQILHSHFGGISVCDLKHIRTP